MTREPLKGRAAWHGKDLDASGDWIRVLDDTQRREIDDALARVKRARLPLFGFTRDDFPLASTADLCGLISDELENGRGMVRLRGLPVERYSDDDLRRIFWGIGTHLGTSVYQNARGEIMGEVRDETKLSEKTYAPTEAGRITSSRARARSTGPLRWHTDRCDVIALLCVRNAKRAASASSPASLRSTTRFCAAGPTCWNCCARTTGAPGRRMKTGRAPAAPSPCPCSACRTAS
jgi:hypothetical protein